MNPLPARSPRRTRRSIHQVPLSLGERAWQRGRMVASTPIPFPRYARKSILQAALVAATLLCAMAASGVAARGADEGQADLDKATELKLGAQTSADFTDVIQFCQSALKKGLDKNNTTFANDLMASALAQRGSITAGKIFGDEGAPLPRAGLKGDRWKTYRDEALADLEKALKLSPKQPQAQLTVARLNLLPGGSVEKAVRALDQTVALSEDDAALRAKALLMRSSLRTDLRQRITDLDEALKALPGNAMLLRVRGLALFEDRRFAASLADFDKAIAAEPSNVAAYELKAAVLAALKKHAEAVATLEKARAVDPRNADLLLSEARVYAAQPDFKRALEQCDRALAIDGANLGALELRAAIYDQQGEREKALADTDKMLRIKPGSPDLMRQRAGLLADLHKFDKACEELLKLHKAAPQDAQTTLQLGMVYQAAKQYDKALAAFDEVLARNPDDFGAIRGRADALLNTGRRGDAIAEYEKAFKLRPHDYGVLNNYAWVLATAPEDKLRDGRRAVDMATEASKATDYKADYILSTLAAAYAETGDFVSARKFAALAVEVSVPDKDEPGRKDELKKELASYNANKKWREALVNGEEVKLPEKGAANKPAQKQRDEKKAEAPKEAGKPASADAAKAQPKTQKKPAPPPEEEDEF